MKPQIGQLYFYQPTSKNPLCLILDTSKYDALVYFIEPCRFFYFDYEYFNTEETFKPI